MSIRVDHLIKSYGDHVVVNRVSFDVAEGECFVLLGPSGSGKSTVLRIAAGLAQPDGGRVVFHGRDVTHVPPQRRGIGFVFQQYALFDHMTVARNVEFPLRVRGTSASERRRRCGELLELVGLVGLGGRHPHQLSGGQQQRVALARALAHRPEVLLLDEPFGALDARIRIELRRTLRSIQRELGVTAIFVTHDQEEAFELADRLGVMNFGRLLEVGPPEELYLRPQTEFVAAFLGKANLMVGQVSPEGVRIGEARFPLGTRSADAGETRRVQVMFRPEDVAVKLTRDALDWPPLGEGVVDEVDFSGSFERLRLRVPRVDGVRPISPPVPFGADHILVEATRSQHLARRYPLHPGDRAWVGVRRLHALTHPGLRFLLFDDGTEHGADAVAYGGELARLCHARVTVLLGGDAHDGDGARVQSLREILGSGLAGLELRTGIDASPETIGREAGRDACDLVIVPRPPRGAAAACQNLVRAAGHPVLVVPRARRSPRSVLVCVAAGEPGKADVLFASRLVRHTGAGVTVLTAVEEGGTPEVAERVERFHAAALRTFALFGIEARGRTRKAPARAAIVDEVRQGGHDLVVLGSPWIGPELPFTLGAVVKSVLTEITDVPLLIVRQGPSA